MKRLLTLGMLCLSSSASAQHLDQHVEFSPSISYTTAGPIDRKAVGVDGLRVDPGITWGGQVGGFWSEHFGAEVFFLTQSTHVSITAGSGTAQLLSTEVHQYHGDVIYQIGSQSRWLRPFVFGGLGMTLLKSPDFATASKASLSVGGGVKGFIWKNVGFKVQARFKPTELGSANSDSCSPFDFCQGTLKQLEIGGGPVFRF